MERKRCGVCVPCQRVKTVQAQAMKALASKPGNGEDVRLIWNTTLQTCPCDDWVALGHTGRTLEVADTAMLVRYVTIVITAQHATIEDRKLKRHDEWLRLAKRLRAEVLWDEQFSEKKIAVNAKEEETVKTPYLPTREEVCALLEQANVPYTIDNDPEAFDGQSAIVVQMDLPETKSWLLVASQIEGCLSEETGVWVCPIGLNDVEIDGGWVVETELTMRYLVRTVIARCCLRR